MLINKKIYIYIKYKFYYFVCCAFFIIRKIYAFSITFSNNSIDMLFKGY